MKREKQTIAKEEPYFVHIGFTYANELIKTQIKAKFKYRKLKTRVAVIKKLNKLRKYWERSLR